MVDKTTIHNQPFQGSIYKETERERMKAHLKEHLISFLKQGQYPLGGRSTSGHWGVLPHTQGCELSLSICSLKVYQLYSIYVTNELHLTLLWEQADVTEVHCSALKLTMGAHTGHPYHTQPKHISHFKHGCLTSSKHAQAQRASWFGKDEWVNEWKETYAPFT